MVHMDKNVATRRGGAALKPFNVLVFNDCMHKVRCAKQNGKLNGFSENLAEEFFVAIALGESLHRGREINIDWVEANLKGCDKMDMLGRMFCKSLIFQARDRNEREERARRLSQPAPPPQTTLIGESRPWFERIFKQSLRMYLMHSAR